MRRREIIALVGAAIVLPLFFIREATELEQIFGQVRNSQKVGVYFPPDIYVNSLSCAWAVATAKRVANKHGTCISHLRTPLSECSSSMVLMAAEAINLLGVYRTPSPSKQRH
jgi:hypothetical protein